MSVMFSNVSSPTASKLKSYFSELLHEMEQLVESPIEYKYSQRLLSQEIRRVWEDMNGNGSGSTTRFSAGREEFEDDRFVAPTGMTPGDARIPSPIYYCSKSKTDIHGLDENHFVTPIRYNYTKYSEDRSQLTDDSDWSQARRNPSSFDERKHITDNLIADDNYVLQTKIMIPDAPQEIDGQPIKCNFIGRILGPSGYTAKYIEKNFNVTLLIRGRGSLKNPKKEKDSIGKSGFEHLNDPLHVLLIAKHHDRQRCEEILKKATKKIESLLTPVHDRLKTDQLMRLSQIKGNYVKKLT